MISEEYYIMWLMSIEGINARKAKMILDFFGDAHNIFKCSESELKKVPQMTDDMANRITKSQNHERLDELIEKLEENNARFISIKNKDYPHLLKQIYDPPVGLYVLGELPDDNLPKISVIGSRICSEYGMTVSMNLSKELAKNGIVIVSGMARGLDSMAHRGTLNGGGLTIAVLGCGIDVCYPPENNLLMKEISQNGCVISEYPIGTRPSKTNFPERNRIISGLSRGIVVVEAARKSGTSITVDQALDQGRDVFAVPGSIYNKYSFGTNELIKSGAIPVTCAEDILLELNLRQQDNIDSENNIEQTEEKIKSLLAPEEKLVYACIGLDPVQIDEITNKVELTIPTVQFVLTKLELKGCIRRLAGHRYMRKL